MKVEVKEFPGAKRELKVEVPPEGFHKDVEEAYLEYRDSARVPGFRKGKVPLKLLKSRYGKAIQKSVISRIIPDLCKEALEAEHLVPVSEPEITVEDYEEGQPLVFTAKLEVRPKVTVTGYDGMEVVRTVYGVTDEDVDQSIQRLRRQQAEEHSADRPAQAGDFLLADVQELDRGGVPLVGQKTENVLMELGGEHSPGPEFEAQFGGVRSGEERRVRFTYRDDYPDKRRAGQPRWLAVRVKEVKERILPALDDEFARDLECESLEDLKAKSRRRLEAQLGYISDQGVRAEITRRLIAANPFEVPESMVENYLDTAAREDEAEALTPQERAEIRNKRKSQAVEDIKSFIILRSIAEAEGIQVTEEDTERRIEQIAEASNLGVNEARRSLQRDSRLDKMKETLLEEKVWEFLMQRVQIKDAAPVPLWVSGKGPEGEAGEAG